MFLDFGDSYLLVVLTCASIEHVSWFIVTQLKFSVDFNLGESSIAASVFVLFELSLTNPNPNNNLMMRRTGLSNLGESSYSRHWDRFCFRHQLLEAPTRAGKKEMRNTGNAGRYCEMNKTWCSLSWRNLKLPLDLGFLRCFCKNICLSYFCFYKHL